MTLQLAERSFRTSNGRLSYGDGGSDESPVVILHGLTQNRQSLEEVVAGLIGTTLVYACDLRGHGSSDWVESGYQISDYADDIAEFVREVSGNGTVVIGFP